MGAGLALSAHDVISTKITWSREISRIVYKRCASCHHEGGSAFSLMTYTEARPWAKAIKEEVLERRMPPFSAVKGFGELRDDKAITQEELHLIADWVEGGSPEGEPSLMPKPPDFTAPAVAEKLPKSG
ncbi:MAG TPA: cytochrome c, partial [Bryobacteraceae bacterium]|nr:cytochrome c [Bryobacteraceae bacterium]